MAVCGVLAYSCEIARFYLYSLHVFAQHHRVMWQHNNKTQWGREEEEEEEQEDCVCKGMSTFWGNTLKVKHQVSRSDTDTGTDIINIMIDPAGFSAFQGQSAVSGVTGGEEPEITPAGSRLDRLTGSVTMVTD